MFLRHHANFLLAVVLLTFVALSEAGNPDLANGFGDSIDWVAWSEAKDKAKAENKPLMLIIHKASCPACKNLKPKFAESEEIQSLSSNFVMVNANNGEEPSSDRAFSPDGSYVPRIIFLNPESEVMKDITNEKGNPKFQYFYFDADSIVASMRRVLQGDKQTEESSEQKEEL